MIVVIGQGQARETRSKTPAPLPALHAKAHDGRLGAILDPRRPCAVACDTQRDAVELGVELEPDPARSALGVVLGRNQRLRQLDDLAVGLHQDPARRRGVVSLGARRAAGDERQQPSILERGRDDAQRLDRLPVDVALEPPGGLGGLTRSERAQRVRRPLDPRAVDLDLEHDGVSAHLRARGAGGWARRRPRDRSPRRRRGVRGPGGEGCRGRTARPECRWPPRLAAPRRWSYCPKPQNATRAAVRRFAIALVIRRTRSRVGGISSISPTTSVMNPGVSSSAPPRITIAPSKTSRAGTRLSDERGVEARPDGAPLRAQEQRPQDAVEQQQRDRRQHADRPADLDDHVELEQRDDDEERDQEEHASEPSAA